MTDSKSKQKSASNNTDKTPQVAKPAKSNQSASVAEPVHRKEVVKQKTPGKGLSLFAILLSIAALAATGFTWYQTQVIGVKQESTLAVGVSEIGGKVSLLGASISQLKSAQSNVVSQADLKSNLLELKTTLMSDVKDVQQNQTQLSESVNKINADLQKGVNQYVVDEVSQLLRLANNSVLFNANIKSAIDALTLADSQLKSLSDPRYGAVRNKINQEISALRNVEQADVAALSAKLHAISTLVPSLALLNEPEESKPVSVGTAETVNTAKDTNWRNELSTLWDEMLSSVKVQRVDQPPKPLLVPEQRYFLNENLQLTLSKAELALLQSQEAVFKRSIGDAVTWLTEYFDLKDAKVSSALTQLKALSDQKISTELPDISGSYVDLQNIKGG